MVEVLCNLRWAAPGHGSHPASALGSPSSAPCRRVTGAGAEWDGPGASQSQMSPFITLFLVPAVLADTSLYIASNISKSEVPFAHYVIPLTFSFH